MTGITNRQMYCLVCDLKTCSNWQVLFTAMTPWLFVINVWIVMSVITYQLPSIWHPVCNKGVIYKPASCLQFHTLTVCKKGMIYRPASCLQFHTLTVCKKGVIYRPASCLQFHTLVVCNKGVIYRPASCLQFHTLIVCNKGVIYRPASWLQFDTLFVTMVWSTNLPVVSSFTP